MKVGLTTDDILVLIKMQAEKLRDISNLYIPAGKEGISHLNDLVKALMEEVNKT